MKINVLASSSRGNSYYIEDGNNAIVIDIGLSGKDFYDKLLSVGGDEKKIKGIIASHDHNDHINGIGVIARRFNLPVYFTEKTYSTIENKLKNVSEINFFNAGEKFQVGSFIIEPYSVPHDAVDPVNFVIRNKKHSICIATDFGKYNKLILHKLMGLDAIILESNYDEEMLMNGPYTYPLKQRIRSNYGHLSNVNTAEIIEMILHSDLRYIVLAHLSQENNLPEIAYKTTKKVLDKYDYNELPLLIAKPYEPLETIYLD